MRPPSAPQPIPCNDLKKKDQKTQWKLENTLEKIYTMYQKHTTPLEQENNITVKNDLDWMKHIINSHMLNNGCATL